MISASAKARHAMGRRLGACMAKAEPLDRRNRSRGSFHAAIFIGYAGNAGVAVYFCAKYFIGYAGNDDRAFYFHAAIFIGCAGNDSMVFIL